MQGVDLVIEGTGVFVSSEGAGKHLTAGAKKVRQSSSYVPCSFLLNILTSYSPQSTRLGVLCGDQHCTSFRFIASKRGGGSCCSTSLGIKGASQDICAAATGADHSPGQGQRHPNLRGGSQR